MERWLMLIQSLTQYSLSCLKFRMWLFHIEDQWNESKPRNSTNIFDHSFRFNLSKKKLNAIPLFEGEELLEGLDLSMNTIVRIAIDNSNGKHEHSARTKDTEFVAQ